MHTNTEELEASGWKRTSTRSLLPKARGHEDHHRARCFLDRDRLHRCSVSGDTAVEREAQHAGENRPQPAYGLGIDYGHRLHCPDVLFLGDSI